MNKILIIIALALFNTIMAHAQSPIIKDLREVISQRNSSFKTLQKELVQDNTEKGIKAYMGSVGGSSICNAFVTQSNGQGSMYIFLFSLENMDIMQTKIFTDMAQQYINELNNMVKTGNYKGRDYRDGESLVTEITDLNGNIVVQYVSNAADHMIMVHGI